MPSLIAPAHALMRKQTLKNRAPVWALTELAVQKGKELARKYHANEELIVTALYLAHTVFSTKIGGVIQKNHANLSSRFAKKYLSSWKVPAAKQAIILNAIEAHHDAIPTVSKEAEIVKNAEGFKFVSVAGALVYLHNLGERGVPFTKAVEQVKYKVKQKFSYLTLPDCKQEAIRNCKIIERILKM